MMTIKTYYLNLLDEMNSARLFAHCLELDGVNTICIKDVIFDNTWYTKIIINCNNDAVEELEAVLGCY